MVNNQVIRGIELDRQVIDRMVISRKLDLTYDLETVLDKLLDKVEAKNI